MVDAITEQSKVTFQRVVREYQRKTCRELTRRRHRSGLAFQQSKPACLLQDMRIHWYDKCALVNETAPQTEVDRRTIPYHPTQKHAYALAGRSRVFRYDCLNSFAREIICYSLHRRQSVSSITLYIISNASILIQHLPKSHEQTIHRMFGVEAVEAFSVVIGYILPEPPICNPPVYIATGHIDNRLYFRHELFSAAIAQA